MLTVHFSNHTGYGAWRGPLLDPADVREVIAGIEDRGRARRVPTPCCRATRATRRSARSVLDTVARVKELNPAAVYCCDPVMGDVGRGMFVRPGIPEFMRDRVVPAADVITPNHFELDFLAGTHDPHPGRGARGGGRGARGGPARRPGDQRAAPRTSPRATSRWSRSPTRAPGRSRRPCCRSPPTGAATSPPRSTSPTCAPPGSPREALERDDLLGLRRPRGHPGRRHPGDPARGRAGGHRRPAVHRRRAPPALNPPVQFTGVSSRAPEQEPGPAPGQVSLSRTADGRAVPPARVRAQGRLRLEDPFVGWSAAVGLGLVALFLRLWRIGTPAEFQFDETYYAKDAWSLVNHGYVRGYVDDADEQVLDGTVRGAVAGRPVDDRAPRGRQVADRAGRAASGWTRPAGGSPRRSSGR